MLCRGREHPLLFVAAVVQFRNGALLKEIRIGACLQACLRAITDGL
jgi:hypothetical protein